MPPAPTGRPAAALPEAVDLIDALQEALDGLPAPLEPLDISALDGFLCGVLLQPQPVPVARWLPYIVDVEGRAPPPALDLRPLQALVARRQAQLDVAIGQRQWFDPWVFELEEDAPPSECVAPWVAGFSMATDLFPGLSRFDAAAQSEPLALLYRHLDPDDLEDADDLLEQIEALEPAEDLAEAVEDLVRATLLLADVSRPRAVAGRPSGGRRAAPSGPPRPRRPGPGRR